MEEGVDRRRKPPARLGVEQERGLWEERLPRELSMGDPGSRQHTPQPSPQPSPPARQVDHEDQQLPAAANFEDQQLPAVAVFEDQQLYVFAFAALKS